MGSYDGAEVCELVGLYLLSQLTVLTGNEFIGLYRDDGLAISPCTSGHLADQLRKKIVAIFKNNKLDITTECNLVQTDFLDLNLDLKSGKYWPYRKPNSEPLYIDARSNHPPSIKKHLPTMIANRISTNSCDLDEFLKAAPAYEEALREARFPAALNYRPQPTNAKRSRKRNVIWFNPPYNEQVSTKMGKEFLKLVDKHFPPHSKLHKLFNRKSIKVSYSCTPSIGSIINQHNKGILRTHRDVKSLPPPKHCNCRVKANCPMNGKCCESSVIYKATLNTGEDEKVYYGSCATTFKARFNNHTHSFREQHKRNATELSKAVWNCKDAKIEPLITWSIVYRAPPYRNGAKRCPLCLAEKLFILQANQKSFLNKRSELISKCRHRNKFKLKNLK